MLIYLPLVAFKYKTNIEKLFVKNLHNCYGDLLLIFNIFVSFCCTLILV